MAIPPWLEELCQRLRANDPDLTNLNLNIRRLNDEYSHALSQSLVHNTVLQVLNLVSSITQTNAEVAILRILPETNLKKLYASYNCIQNVGALAVGTALRSSTLTLKELHLDYNNITAEGAKSIAQGLQENQTLEICQLNCNDIGEDGAVEFGRMLERNTTLHKLGLNRNRITSHGGMALWEGLQTNVTLQELSLSQNNLIPSPVVEKIDFTTRANQCGRYLLRLNDSPQGLPIGLWSHVLAHANDNPEMIYYFLSAQPELMIMTSH